MAFGSNSQSSPTVKEIHSRSFNRIQQLTVFFYTSRLSIANPTSINNNSTDNLTKSSIHDNFQNTETSSQFYINSVESKIDSLSLRGVSSDYTASVSYFSHIGRETLHFSSISPTSTSHFISNYTSKTTEKKELTSSVVPLNTGSVVQANDIVFLSNVRQTALTTNIHASAPLSYELTVQPSIHMCK